MCILLIIFSFFIGLYNVQAHEANIKGYNNKDTEYVSLCNNHYYGYHKKDGKNHWHEVEYKNNKWIIINSKESTDYNPCDKDEKTSVTLKKCVDGDTAVFIVDNKEIKYRFLAVDTPESVHPNKAVESYAKEASKSTCDFLTNANVIQVEYDSNSDKTDKYGRQLVWVWVDDILLQKLMISGGYARVAYVYGKYKYLDELCSIQSDAISSKKGIWNYDYEEGYCSTHKKGISVKYDNVNIYKILFIDGDNENSSMVAGGMKIKEPDVNIKIGYKFVGWYNGDEKYNFNSPINSDLILTAKYQKDYILWLTIIILAVSYLFTISNKRRKNGKKYKKSIK